MEGMQMFTEDGKVESDHRDERYEVGGGEVATADFLAGG